MYLSKWCDLQKIGQKELKQKLQPVSPSSVNKWLRSRRFPSVEMLIKIEQLTDGAVTANDFVKQWQEQQGQHGK